MRVGLRVLTPLIALLAVTAVACGSQPETHPNDHGKKGPITARALAAIVQDHLSDQMGKATSARPELDGPRAVGGVGTEVRFRAKGEPVAPAVSVSVGSKASAAKFTCKRLQDDFYSGCAAIEGGVLFWENGTPEGDPGVVYVALRKGDATVLLFDSGPPISKDPRQLDLRVSVEELFAIAKDPRVDLTTSASALQAGQELDSWSNNP